MESDHETHESDLGLSPLLEVSLGLQCKFQMGSNLIMKVGGVI